MDVGSYIPRVEEGGRTFPAGDKTIFLSQFILKSVPLLTFLPIYIIFQNP